MARRETADTKTEKEEKGDDIYLSDDGLDMLDSGGIAFVTFFEFIPEFHSKACSKNLIYTFHRGTSEPDCSSSCMA